MIYMVEEVPHDIHRPENVYCGDVFTAVHPVGSSDALEHTVHEIRHDL